PRSLADAPVVPRTSPVHGAQPPPPRTDLHRQARRSQALRLRRRAGGRLAGAQRRSLDLPDGPDEPDLPAGARRAVAVSARRRGAQAPPAAADALVPPAGYPRLREPDRGDHGSRDGDLAGRRSVP